MLNADYYGLGDAAGAVYRVDCNGTKNTQSAGDWLRANARREFGRSIAARWFN